MESPAEEPKNMGEVSSELRKKILEDAVILENFRNKDALIDIVNINDFDKYLNENAATIRHRAIIEVDGHYMAADMLNNANQKTCILLDAASDHRYFPVLMKLENEYGYKLLSPYGFFNSEDEKSLQNDTSSCSLFAFDHCVQFALAPDELHAQLENQLVPEDGNSLTWNKMPPNFLWNVQSLKTVEKYIEEHPTLSKQKMQNGLSFEEYTQLGKGESDGLRKLPINDSINRYVFSKAFKSHKELTFPNDEMITDRAELIIDESTNDMRNKVQEIRKDGTEKLDNESDCSENISTKPTT